MGLGALQKSFAGSVMSPDRSNLPGLLGEIVAGGTLTVGQAIDVHRNGYYARLTEQLGETFEAVWWVLGDQAFFDTCAAYIGSTPSCSYNLSDYGASFPEFAATSEQGARLAFLEDLATFEWRFKELFHTREHSHVGSDELEALDDLSTARFELGAACFLFASRYGVYEIWKNRRSDQSDNAAMDWRTPQRLLGYKRDGKILVTCLEQVAFQTLARLAEGHTVGETIEAVSEAHPEFDEAAVSRLFETVFKTGIVTRIG